MGLAEVEENLLRKMYCAHFVELFVYLVEKFSLIQAQLVL